MPKNKITKTLLIDFVINTVLTSIELVAGTVSGSVVLLADGFQNLTDSIVIIIAFLTERLTSKLKRSKRKQTKIYRIAGCTNAFILMALAVYISLLAYHRLSNPQAVNNHTVIGIGLLSITINGYAAGLLHKNRNEKSIRAPYAGLIFSGISGAGAFISGIVGQLLHLQRIDAFFGLGIAAVLFIRSGNLLFLALKDK